MEAELCYLQFNCHWFGHVYYFRVREPGEIDKQFSRSSLFQRIFSFENLFKIRFPKTQSYIRKCMFRITVHICGIRQPLNLLAAHRTALARTVVHNAIYTCSRTYHPSRAIHCDGEVRIEEEAGFYRCKNNIIPNLQFECNVSHYHRWQLNFN